MRNVTTMVLIWSLEVPLPGLAVFTNIGSILKKIFYNDVVIFSTSDKNMV
jgi:hypothetical protein